MKAWTAAIGIALVVVVGVWAQGERRETRLNPAVAERINEEPASAVVEYLLSALSPAAVEEATAALAIRYLEPARARAEARLRELERARQELDRGVVAATSIADASENTTGALR